MPSLKAASVASAIEANRYASRTLVFDQMSAFMSDLMKNVLRILRVKSEIASTGYHALTPTAECYVQTVEDGWKP